MRKYFARLDTATVLIAFLIQILVLLLVAVLAGNKHGVNIFDEFSNVDLLLMLALQAFVELAMLSVLLFIVAIIVRVVLSLIGRYFGPISDMLADLTEPLLRPVRRIIPPLGVVDISAYVVIVLLLALNMILADLLPGIR